MMTGEFRIVDESVRSDVWNNVCAIVLHMERQLHRILPIIPVTDLRNQAKQALKQAQDQPIVITQNGRPSAVLIDYQSYNALVQMADRIRELEAEERSFWQLASAESLQKIWDNPADAIYDNWKELYGKTA